VTAKRLTDPRGQILAAIRSSMRTRGYPPTMRELATAAGFSSTGTVSYHLRAMAADGLIRRDPGKPRALVIADIHPRNEAVLGRRRHRLVRAQPVRRAPHARP
jgi:repressor LexA